MLFTINTEKKTIIFFGSYSFSSIQLMVTQLNKVFVDISEWTLLVDEDEQKEKSIPEKPIMPSFDLTGSAED